KTSTVDAVVYLVYARRGYADSIDKPVFQIFAHGNKMSHQGADRLAQEIVFTIFPIQVNDITAMLTVHPHARACNGGDNLSFYRRKIAGMHNIRPQPSEGTE